jgi:hypothetical protein
MIATTMNAATSERARSSVFDLAVEPAKFKSCGSLRDAREHQARSAFRAAESLNCEQWDSGGYLVIAIQLRSGGSAKLSVTDRQTPKRGGDGTE